MFDVHDVLEEDLRHAGSTRLTQESSLESIGGREKERRTEREDPGAATWKPAVTFARAGRAAYLAMSRRDVSIRAPGDDDASDAVPSRTRLPEDGGVIMRKRALNCGRRFGVHGRQRTRRSGREKKRKAECGGKGKERERRRSERQEEGEN